MIQRIHQFILFLKPHILLSSEGVPFPFFDPVVDKTIGNMLHHSWQAHIANFAVIPFVYNKTKEVKKTFTNKSDIYEVHTHDNNTGLLCNPSIKMPMVNGSRLKDSKILTSMQTMISSSRSHSSAAGREGCRYRARIPSGIESLPTSPSVVRPL